MAKILTILDWSKASTYNPTTVNNQNDEMRPGRGQKSSEFLVPFFCELANIQTSPFTNAVSNSIIELDNLAIQVDHIIDKHDSLIKNGASIENFPDLSNKIIKCLDAIKDYPGYKRVTVETLEAVKHSFKYNTAERHQVYYLEGGKQSNICTTLYLYPLIKHLHFQCTSQQFDLKKLFILISNYIQLVDDFTDLFVDLESQVLTPVTRKYYSLYSESNSYNIDNTFVFLITLVKDKLEEYLLIIESEIKDIFGTNVPNSILHEWYMFHTLLAALPLPSVNDRIEQKKYLELVHGIKPPILCYIN